MSLIPCRECKKEISSEADKCPNCGIAKEIKKPNEKNKIIILIILLTVIALNYSTVFAGLKEYFTSESFLITNYFDEQVNQNLNHIQMQVADDAVKQYEIAKRSGSAMDAYFRAGLVAEAYLQAKDEGSYQQWKAIEAEEKQRTGMNF